jgi:hypothetical protein
MEDLLSKIMPYLEWTREKIFMTVANIISKQFELDVQNVYTILIMIFSLWLGNKLLKLNYASNEGRGGYLIIISAIIFYVLRYLGVN